jgi:hypothetical protein
MGVPPFPPPQGRSFHQRSLAPAVQPIKSGACGSATAATNHDASDANYSSNLISDVDESKFLPARLPMVPWRFSAGSHWVVRIMKRKPTLEILNSLLTKHLHPFWNPFIYPRDFDSNHFTGLLSNQSFTSGILSSKR